MEFPGSSPSPSNRLYVQRRPQTGSWRGIGQQANSKQATQCFYTSVFESVGNSGRRGLSNHHQHLLLRELIHLSTSQEAPCLAHRSAFSWCLDFSASAISPVLLAKDESASHALPAAVNQNGQRGRSWRPELLPRLSLMRPPSMPFRARFCLIWHASCAVGSEEIDYPHAASSLGTTPFLRQDFLPRR